MVVILNREIVCRFCVTCHTTGSMWSAVVNRQMLSTSVCDAEVSTLAMMASRMEKGSIV